MGSKISILIILIAMVIMAGTLFSDNNTTSSKDDVTLTHRTYIDTITSNDNKPLPTFEDYSTIDTYEGEQQPIDFSTNPRAIASQEMIQSGYEAVGVNFASQYSVVTWGCGVDCQQSTIINAKNGKIIEHGIISETGVSFSSASLLFIVNPPTKESESLVIDYYIIGDDESFTLIAKNMNGKNIVEGCINAVVKARNFVTAEVVDFESPCKIPFGWEIVEA